MSALLPIYTTSTMTAGTSIVVWPNQIANLLACAAAREGSSLFRTSGRGANKAIASSRPYEFQPSRPYIVWPYIVMAL